MALCSAHQEERQHPFLALHHWQWGWMAASARDSAGFQPSRTTVNQGRAFRGISVNWEPHGTSSFASVGRVGDKVFRRGISANFPCKVEMLKPGHILKFTISKWGLLGPSHFVRSWVQVDLPPNVSIKLECQKASMGRVFSFDRSPVASWCCFSRWVYPVTMLGRWQVQNPKGCHWAQAASITISTRLLSPSDPVGASSAHPHEWSVHKGRSQGQVPWEH